MKRLRAVLVTMALASLVMVPALIGSPATAQSGLSGRVMSGPVPLESYVVELYGTSGGSEPVLLGVAQSAADGSFNIDYAASVDPSAVHYLVAIGAPFGGNVALTRVLGVGPVPANVVVNERTTVATAYAMAQFTDLGAIRGTYPGLQNAAGMAHNLVDVATGEIGTVLASPPNGSETSTLRTFNSMANALRSCVVDDANCDDLYAVAQLASGGVPINTFQALVEIARNPGAGAADLFDLSLAVAPDLRTSAGRGTVRLDTCTAFRRRRRDHERAGQLRDRPPRQPLGRQQLRVQPRHPRACVWE